MPSEESNSLPLLTVIGAAGEAAEGVEQEGAPAHPSPPDPPQSAEGAPDPAKPSARERLTSRKREARPRKRRGGLIALIVFIALVLAVAAAAVGGFAWLRWYAHDDAADFQGTWYVSGTETPIEITADAIVLTDKVSYGYKLNVQDKTLEMSLGNMRGYGSYRFSLDRTQLVIFDGQVSADAVLNADVRWLVQALIDEVSDESNDVRGGARKNLTWLTREPLTEQEILEASGASATAPEASDSDEGADDSSAAASGGEQQPVWSAEEWRNGGDSAGSTASTADDVGALLENINDLPAE